MSLTSATTSLINGSKDDTVTVSDLRMVTLATAALTFWGTGKLTRQRAEAGKPAFYGQFL